MESSDATTLPPANPGVRVAGTAPQNLSSAAQTGGSAQFPPLPNSLHAPRLPAQRFEPVRPALCSHSALYSENPRWFRYAKSLASPLAKYLASTGNFPAAAPATSSSLFRLSIPRIAARII